MTAESAVAWSLVTLFVLLLIAGVGLGLWSLVRQDGSRGSRAAEILGERLARGEIAPDEYRERLSVIEGADRAQRPRAGLVAVVLVAIGAVGTVAAGAWAVTSSWDWMQDMMDGDMGSMMSMMQGGSTERSAPTPRSDARTLTVEAREFSFTPSEIRLRPGETVNIELENVGRMFHTLTIGELDFDLRAQSGDAIAGALSVERPGTYEFICTVPQHAESGMRGRLVVSE